MGRDASTGNELAAPESMPRATSTGTQQAEAPPTLAKKIVAVLAMIGVQISFGLYFVISSDALSKHGLNPLVFALLRDTGGAAVLLSSAVLMHGWPKQLTLGDCFLFTGVGLFGVYFGQMFPAIALSHISATNVALLQPSAPAFTSVLAGYLGMERYNLRTRVGLSKAGGLALAVAGAVVVVVLSTHHSKSDGSGGGSGAGHSTFDFFYGNAIILVQCVSSAGFLCIQKVLLQRYPALTVAALAYSFGDVLVVLGTLPSGVLVEASSWDIPQSGTIAIAYAILVSSALSYFIVAWANKQTNPAVVVATSTFNPVAAAFFSWVCLGDDVTVADVVGGALVLGGLLLMVLAKVGEWKEDERTEEVRLLKEASHMQGDAGYGAVPTVADEAGGVTGGDGRDGGGSRAGARA